MIDRYTACAVCGAVVTIEAVKNDLTVVTVLDGKDQHAAWHKELGLQVLNARLQLPLGPGKI